ncbi:MAG: hypothetical protein ACRD9S_15630 [Pyrinomonadaceae bacterium]
MSPEEDVRITKKQRRAEVLSWLLAVPIGLLIVGMIVLYKLTVGDGKLFVGEVIYPIGFVAVALSSFFVGRVYRKHMERKLGRRLKNEYELTSLTSWMEASNKDEPQPK